MKIVRLGKTPVLPKLRPSYTDSAVLRKTLASLRMGEAVKIQGLPESLVRNIASLCGKEARRAFVVRTRPPSIFVWRGQKTNQVSRNKEESSRG